MTTLRNDLPAVLRRRARELAGEYADNWVAPLLRAADELDVRARCDVNGAEQEAVNRAAENQRYRKALTELFAAIHGSTMERSRRDRCEEIIKRCLSYGGKRPKRNVIAIELTPGFTRDELLAHFTTQLEAMDLGGTDGNEEGDEEEGEEPLSAGRDADQPASGEEADPAPGAGKEG